MAKRDEPLAVVAALRAEVASLRASLTGRRRLAGVGIPVWEGRLGNRPLWVAICGPGPQRAAAGIDRLLSATSPSRLLLMGIAGGLSPGLSPGGLVEAGEVVEPEGGSWRPSPGWGAAPAAVGMLATVPRIVVSREEKARLWERLGRREPAAVDTETAVWVRSAERHGVPWRAVRAISDPAEETLPLDFNRFLDRHGAVSAARVALYAAPRPALWSELAVLSRRLRTASAALASEAERIVDA